MRASLISLSTVSYIFMSEIVCLKRLICVPVYLRKEALQLARIFNIDNHVEVRFSPFVITGNRQDQVTLSDLLINVPGILRHRTPTLVL